MRLDSSNRLSDYAPGVTGEEPIHGRCAGFRSWCGTATPCPGGRSSSTSWVGQLVDRPRQARAGFNGTAAAGGASRRPRRQPSHRAVARVAPCRPRVAWVSARTGKWSPSLTTPGTRRTLSGPWLPGARAPPTSAPVSASMWRRRHKSPARARPEVLRGEPCAVMPGEGSNPCRSRPVVGHHQAQTRITNG